MCVSRLPIGNLKKVTQMGGRAVGPYNAFLDMVAIYV